jgi:DNA primase
MTVVDEIKAKLDIVSYIQQYVPLKKAGRSYKACCPFHVEKTPSFVVNPDAQSWRCFGACNEGGDIFSFAQKRHGWSFTEALQELGRQAGVEVRKQTPEQRAKDDRLDILRGVVKAAADFYVSCLMNSADVNAARTLAYVKEKRGFSDETIAQFGIGYAPPSWQNTLDHLKLLGYTEDQIIETGLAVRSDEGRVYDRFRNRLLIPIRDERARVIGFGARALDPDDNPKYLNSPQTPLFDKSRTLFALDTAKSAIRDGETVVIVEGYMDAIQAHQAGFTNVVAQMGTALTEIQLKQLARWARRIVLALDSDAAGQNATMRSLEVARETLIADYSGRLSVDMRILQIPDAKDPDDMIRETPERWAALVESARPVADYVIEVETAALPANASVQEREATARRLLPILAASENNLYTKDNIQKLALKLHIGERDLIFWANEQRRIARAKPPRQAAPRAAVEEPPDWPSPDYDDWFVPDEEESGAPVRKTGAARRQVSHEEYCLRILLEHPDLYYQVNRKLRELAGDNRRLRDGPLGEWCADDFSQSNCRALMLAFREAMTQDDLEPVDYLRATLDTTLAQQLEALMVHELDDLRVKLRYGLVADFTDLRRMHEKRVLSSLDLGSELVKEALRLRNQRLLRERQDMRFLQMDGQGEDMYGSQVILSSLAKQLIEAELHKQNGLSN